MPQIINTSAPEYVEYDGEGKAIITLSRPLMVAGVPVPKITMWEPTVKDERIAAKMGGTEIGERELKLLSNLCDILPDDMDNMPSKDYKRIQEAYLGFLA